MKKDISIYVNGIHYSLTGKDVFSTLSDFLRHNLRLVGTKIMCSEGDCGACTVLIGRPERLQTNISNPESNVWIYQSVDSCIQFMFQLESCHIVTIEGLTIGSNSVPSLSPIQQAMVDHQGSQCGYCTPGFVMSLAGMRECDHRLESYAIREGLSGNLCRCTGYVSIEESALDERFANQKTMQELYSHKELSDSWGSRANEDVHVETHDGESSRVAFVPTKLEQALNFLDEHPKATIIAGASDVGVWHCKSGFQPTTILCINRIQELQKTYAGGDHFEGEPRNNSIVFGTSVTWEAVRKACEASIPQFDTLLSLFGSPQIRHVGTIGGNIVNGSPIADSLPIFFVLDAKLRLASAKGSRWVSMNSFYTGYKKNVMKAGEMLTHVELPVPKSDEIVKLYKVSRRRDMDISTFTAAIKLDLARDTIDGSPFVNSIRIALGGVGPLVVRATKTENFLQGKEWTEQIVSQAGDIAVTEVAPITDVRGSEKYRRTLTKNIFQRFYFETVLGNELVLEI